MRLFTMDDDSNSMSFDMGQEFDEFDSLFCDNPAVQEVINNTQWYVEKSCNKESLISLLAEVGITGLLEQNLYLHSNNIISRPLLDYPDFLLWRHSADKSGLVVNLFYNQTSAGYYTKNSTNICSYLAVSSPDFRATLQNIFDRVALLKPDLLPFEAKFLFDLLDLFSPFTTQERRMGFMFCGKHKFDHHWHANIQVPWYYLERNHFVNPQGQADIENLMSDLTGIPPDQVNQSDQIAFQNAHFISDKMGIGDTRFMIDHPVIKQAWWTMRVGGLVTLPTAFAMKRGLKGSAFCRITRLPLLDLCDIFNTVNTALPEGSSLTFNEVLGTQANYFLAVLDNLNAMVLESPLGNGGHLEFGVYMKNKFPVSMYINRPWSRRLIWRSYTFLQYQLPAWETRSFILPVDTAAFAKRTFEFEGTDVENMLQAIDDYDFIITQLSERLFPIALHTKVHPRWFFRMSSQVAYETPNGGFTAGTDTWLKCGESFSEIRGLPSVLKHIDVCDAKASFAYQAKVFGSAYFKKIKPEQIWACGIGGDYTYWSKGIGQDFTLNFFADVTF